MSSIDYSKDGINWVTIPCEGHGGVRIPIQTGEGQWDSVRVRVTPGTSFIAPPHPPAGGTAMNPSGSCGDLRCKHCYRG